MEDLKVPEEVREAEEALARLDEEKWKKENKASSKESKEERIELQPPLFDPKTIRPGRTVGRLKVPTRKEKERLIKK